MTLRGTYRGRVGFSTVSIEMNKPPFGALDVTVEGSIYAAFTLGGLHTRPSGEVLRSDGSAIAGLYAAGRTTSGVSAFGYVSGASLADGMMVRT